MNDTLFVTLLAAGILYGTPLVLAGIGELFAERSGVMNLGVEAMMLMGAATAFWTSQSFDGPGWIALSISLAVAAATGTVLAAIYAFTVVTLRASQIVAGLALLILGGATGLSSYIASIGDLARETGKHRLPDYDPFGLADLPVIGPLLFDQNALVYGSWVLVVLASLYLYRTRPGLHLRAVGEDPKSADAMGVNVVRYRYAHTMLGGAMAGIAGGVLHPRHRPELGRQHHRGGRLDRDRAGHYLVLAAGAAAGRRLPVRDRDQPGIHPPDPGRGPPVTDLQRHAVSVDHRGRRARLQRVGPRPPASPCGAGRVVQPRGRLTRPPEHKYSVI